MTEHVITVTFEVESEAYQAINSLKRDFINNDYVISHIELVKKANGHIASYDSFDSGVNTMDDSARGGIIGSLVGILGGPVGVILGASWGTLIGAAVDTGDATKDISLLEKVSAAIPDGKTALLILAQENESDSVNRKLSNYHVEILRQDAAEVAAEIEEAAKLQIKMERETRKRLRAEKKDDYKQKVQKKADEIKERFSSFKKKHS